MLDKYTKNKDIFNLCLKYASTQTKSKAATDIYLTFLKLAAAGDIEDKMLSLTENRIKETLGYCRNLEQFEKNKKYLIRDLESGLDAMAMYIRIHAKTKYLSKDIAAGASERILNEKAQEIIDLATTYLSTKFVDNAIKNILPKYIYPNANDFQLKAVLNGLINEAYRNSKLEETSNKLQSKMQRKLREEGQSIESAEEGYEAGAGGFQLVDPKSEQYFESKNVDKSTEESLVELKNIFQAIIKDPKQDVLSYYVEEGLLPKFELLRKNYYIANTPQEKADSEQKLREFYDYAQGFIAKNFSEKIWNPKEKRHHNLSQAELQNMLKTTVEKLNLEDLSERIIKQEFHQLPLRLRRLVDEHPEFVKAAIQSLIKTKLVYNTKDELDAPLAAAEGASRKTTIDPETGQEIKEKTQGRGGLGRGPLDETKFLFHLLTKNIRSMSIDNEQKENFLRQALALLEGSYSTPTAENPVAKPMVQGGKEKGSLLRKGLYQHTIPLTHAGLIDRYREQAGENFENLTDEKRAEIVNQIYRDVHNQESAHLPHSSKSGDYTFSHKGHSELGEEAERIIKEGLRARLEAAEKIHKKEQEPHTFMENSEPVFIENSEPVSGQNINANDENTTASVLSNLILKYAFKY